MDLNYFRILGSGFSKEEYVMYRLGDLEDPHRAMRFLSNRHNHHVFRPAVNHSFQKHILEDKWVTQQFFSGLRIPMPEAYGLYHPVFGMTSEGMPLCSPEHLAALLRRRLSQRLIFKPRVGSQGRGLILASFRDEGGDLRAAVGDQDYSLSEFVKELLCNVELQHCGSTQWIIQECVPQHSFLSRISPYGVNTIRIVTFITSDDIIKIPLSALRLGRKGEFVDNWSRGGFSVAVDRETGRLGKGYSKPRFGGEWAGAHPDTGVEFEGLYVPEWDKILDLCRRAASSLSDLRTVGWDVALTENGPMIIEGNPVWGLPVVQIHTKGYLTDEVREDLAKYGAIFPDKLRPLPLGMLALFIYQWRRSGTRRVLEAWWGRLVKKLFLV